MRCSSHWKTILALTFGCLCAVALLAQQATKKLQIDVTEDLFGDTPKQTAEATDEPFRKLMERETGYTGDVVTVKTAHDLAKQMDKKQPQLGVFEGFEFAWIQPENKELHPLVIAVNERQTPRALIVVPKNSPAKTFADLKGGAFDLPMGSKGYVRLFVDRLARKQGQTTKKFFSKIQRPSNVEDALDDAVDSQVPAVAVDSVALDRYRQRKPGRYQGLRVLAQSPRFPAVAVVYRTGVFDDATLASFRHALLTASDNHDGRRVLTLWKLTAFQNVPKNYDQTLTAIRKAYPPPNPKK
jgi:ABC-type phosphate/phosphonate transport system substrate-binding protein